MRKLTDLLQGQERVWFWIGDDTKLQKRFVNDCIACGGSMKPDAACGWVMALHADLTTRFISMLPWVCSFKPGFGFSDVVKVDYRKFADGQSGYIMTESGFTGG